MGFRKSDRLVRLKPKKRRPRQKDYLLDPKSKAKMYEMQKRLNLGIREEDEEVEEEEENKNQLFKKKPVFLSPEMATTPYAVIQREENQFRILAGFESVSQAKKYLEAVFWKDTISCLPETQRYDIMHRTTRIDSVSSTIREIPPGCTVKQQRFAVVREAIHYDFEILLFVASEEEAYDLIANNTSLAVLPVNVWLLPSALKAAFLVSLVQRADARARAQEVVTIQKRIDALCLNTTPPPLSSFTTAPSAQNAPHLLDNVFARLENLHNTADSRQHKLNAFQRIPNIHRTPLPPPASPISPSISTAASRRRRTTTR